MNVRLLYNVMKERTSNVLPFIVNMSVDRRTEPYNQLILSTPVGRLVRSSVKDCCGTELWTKSKLNN